MAQYQLAGTKRDINSLDIKLNMPRRFLMLPWRSRAIRRRVDVPHLTDSQMIRRAVPTSRTLFAEVGNSLLWIVSLFLRTCFPFVHPVRTAYAPNIPTRARYVIYRLFLLGMWTIIIIKFHWIPLNSTKFLIKSILEFGRWSLGRWPTNHGNLPIFRVRGLPGAK